jgi:lipopolysaccharide export system protein LptA
MFRFFVFFLVFCNITSLFAQQQGKKITFRADMQYHDVDYLPDVDRLIGNVVFTHENTIGYADSAYYYVNENKMIAFARPVKIFVNDTVTLYGNRAMYDGNSKVSTISRNVILKDNTSVLYTDSLTYYTDSGIGYYLTGGKMISNEDTLTSRIGRYNTHTNMANFRREVTLKNPTYTMTCDSFNYNTDLDIVYFLCRTHLVSEENDIFTNSGWYDTKNNYSHLFDSVKIINKDQELTSDTAYYDKNIGFGIAKNNITLVDTARGYVVKGEYGEYSEKGGLSWITDSALLILIDKENRDSLYLHADTLKMYFDSIQNPELLLAFFHVKFFNKEFQGACDSMSYCVEDSVGYMFYNPVVWNKKNQMFGDTIRFSVLDSITSIIELLKDAFVISDVFDEVEFNQVKGKTVVGYIRDKELTVVNVINNVELVYYVMDEDTLLIGINRMETNEMKMFLQENEIEELRFYDYPDGKLWSDTELPMSDRLLKDFRWLDTYRPKQIEDIFTNPIPREKEKRNEEQEVEDIGEEE